MKRGRTCGRCEYLGVGQNGSFEEGPRLVCQHARAVKARTENERLIETQWRPHWCPK